MVHKIINNVVPTNILLNYKQKIWDINSYFNETPTELTLAGKTYDIANTLVEKYKINDFVESHAQKFVGSNRIFPAGWQLRMDRPSNASELLAWHRDYDYFQQFGIKGCVAWIPLTNISKESGGIEIANGDFSLNSLKSAKKIISWPGRKPHEVWECDYSGTDNISVCCEPGGIALFDLLTPHRSIPNHSKTTRITLQIRFFAWDSNTNATRSDIESI